MPSESENELKRRVYEMRNYLAGNGPFTDEMQAFWWAEPMQGLNANSQTLDNASQNVDTESPE